jgi:ABC-2 type transport system permease protein
MRALFLKEISSFLSSIIGYVFILIYLIASGLFHWILSYNTNLLEGSTADLIPFFNMSPVIFLILIPAITMRSIAEERRTGTIELLLTRPISDFQLIFAKYLVLYLQQNLL